MGSGAERVCKPWELDSDLWVVARGKESAEKLKTPKQEEKKFKNDNVRCWKEETIESEAYWDSSSEKGRQGPQRWLKKVKEEGNREVSGVWCMVKWCLKIDLESFRLLSGIWAEIRDIGCGNTIHPRVLVFHPAGVKIT